MSAGRETYIVDGRKLLGAYVVSIGLHTQIRWADRLNGSLRKGWPGPRIFHSSSSTHESTPSILSQSVQGRPIAIYRCRLPFSGIFPFLGLCTSDM